MLWISELAAALLLNHYWSDELMRCIDFFQTLIIHKSGSKVEKQISSFIGNDDMLFKLW